ncbi:diguanylate cyclase domain-containing protein [Methylibium sp.]|uniref:diguanylate cyclase domain-containing protein n=1 Tax=Methylibium sp. TaxID=2067992 RepID=UPI003D1511B7
MNESPSPTAPRTAPVTLHSALLAAAVLVLIALGVVTQLSLNSEYRHEVQRALRDTERSAQKLAVRVGEVLDHVDQTTLLVKSLRETSNPMSLSGLRTAGLVQLDSTRALLTTDRRGFVEDSTSPDVALNLADEDDFKRLVRDPALQLTLGVPQPDHLNGGWMMPVMRRFAREGAFDGVVVAMVDPASLTKGFGDGEAPGTVVTVIGLDNVNRSRLLDGSLSFGEKVDAQKVMRRGHAMHETLQPSISQIDGVARFFTAIQLDTYPLIAIVAVAADSVMAGYQETRRRILTWAATVALLVVAGTLALWQQARGLDTSRREARQAKALYVATLDGSLDALWLLRAERNVHGQAHDFVITDANTRAGTLLGLSRDAMIGHLATELVPSIRHDGLLRLLLTVLERQQPMAVEAPAAATQAKGRWMHFQVVPVEEGVALITRDIDDRKLAERQLAERESFFRTLLDVLPLSVAAKSARADTFGRYLYWNAAAERIFDTPATQVIGRRASDFLEAGLAQQLAQRSDALLADPRVMYHADLELQRPGGMGKRYLDLTKAPVWGADGEIDHILVIADDVTEKRVIADRLRLASRVVQETGDAIVLTDRDDRIVQANAAFVTMTDQALDALIGRHAAEAGLPALRDATLPGIEFALGEHHRWAGESTQQRADRSRFETWLNVTAIADEQGVITHYARLFSDITMLKAQERQLAELARRDALTQLSNRRHFEEHLEQAAARAQRSGRPLALIYLDLDGFKRVNDTLGHEAGDQLLVAVARRLTACVRTTDLVSRLGGDEFTVILEDAGGEANRLQQCERILAVLSGPHVIAGQQVTSTPSVGMAVYVPAESPGSLRKRADAAMYEAKRAGKACVHMAVVDGVTR